jgi:hypothetical protein
MWKQVSERLLSGMAISFELAWFVCAVGTATWILGVTGTNVGPWAYVGIFTLIWLLPIGVVVAFDEFVVRRIRYGARLSGRHKRGPVDPNQVRTAH